MNKIELSDAKRQKAFKQKDRERNKLIKEHNMSFMSHRKIIGQKIAEETDRACNDF